MNAIFKDELTERLRRACLARKVAGAAIALARNGNRVSVSYGVGSGARPFSAQSPVLIGCIAKSLTALVLVRLLARSGQLTLDATVASLLEPLPPAATEILANVTLAQLLNHSHGLQDSYLDHVPRDTRGWIDRDALFMELAANGRLFAPGRAYSYGSVGYWLAGAIIEKLTAQPLRTVAVTELLQPLDIANALEHETLCPSFGQDAQLHAEGLRTLIETQLASTPEYQTLRERAIRYPGWSVTSRAAACGWNCLGDGWYGMNAVFREHSAVLRFCPDKQLALAVTSHTNNAYQVMASVFGEVLPELMHATPKPRTLTNGEIVSRDWSACLGEYRSPAAQISVRRGERPHLPLHLTLRRRSASPIAVHLRPADHGVFFAVPSSRGFSSFQFVSLEGEPAPLLWNGTHLWKSA